MGWALFVISILAMISHSVLRSFGGALAAKLRLWTLVIFGVALMLTALNLLFFVEPWITPEKGLPPVGVHSGNGVVLYGIIAFVLYAGPQLTGLTLAAVSLYVLRGARDMYWMLRR
jgi:hypothetical protein